MNKRYLGDAVYVEDDGYHIVLTTSNGLRDTNRIYLEPAVWEKLLRWVNDPQRTASALDRGAL